MHTKGTTREAPTKRTAGFPGGVPMAWQIAGVGEVNGDGKADFEIHVNASSLSKGDFVL